MAIVINPLDPGAVPGASTISSPDAGSQWGRNRIDKGVKGVFLLGEVPPLSVHNLIVANDNFKAPVALAA